jgi:acylglycerol lipase
VIYAAWSLFWRLLCLFLLLFYPSVSSIAAENPVNETVSSIGQIPLRTWTAAGVPSKASILCLHGLGLNSDAFNALAQQLAPLGYTVYAMDVRGFGEWQHEGKKGKRINFTGAMNDVGKMLHYITNTNPGKPLFVLGESMGGAMAVHTAALYPNYLTGVIASAPAGQRYDQGLTDLDVAFHFLRGPRRNFDIGQRIVDQATDSLPLRTVWGSDPLDRMDLSPADLIKFQHFMDENNELAKKISSLPILVIQGADDHLVRPKGTLEIYNNIRSPNKSLLVIGDAEHLIWEDAQFNPDDFKQLNAWLTKQLDNRG